MSLLAKNTLYLTLASTAQKILAFGYFIYLARVLQPELTGTYSLVLSLTLIFGVLADFGLTPVIIREVAKEPGQAKRMIGEVLAVKLPLILLAATGAYLACLILGYSTHIQQLVLLAVLVMALDAISLLFYGVLRGFQQLVFESWGMFLGQTISTILGSFVLFFSPSLSLLILALLAGSTFNVFFSLWRIIVVLGISCLRPRAEKGSIKRMVRVAFPFALAAIFVKIYSSVDTVLLSKYLGLTAVGIYSVAYKFTYAFQFLPMAFTAALYPAFSSRMQSDREGLATTFNTALWYMMLIVTPIVFGMNLVAADVVRLAGEGYAEAISVLQVLVFALVPIFLDFPIGSLLSAAGRQTTKTTIMGVTMVINLLLNFLLIPAYGVIGAAYAALISFAFLFLAGLTFVPRIIPSFRFRSLFATLLPIAASGAVMFFAGILMRPNVSFPLLIVTCVIVYGLGLLLTRSLRREHLRLLFGSFSGGGPV